MTTLRLSDDSRFLEFSNGRRLPVGMVDRTSLQYPTVSGKDHWFHTRRCRVRLESGFDISIVWGTGTYGPNHHHAFDAEEIVEEPSYVEVAVFDRNGNWANDAQDVFSYVDVDDVLQLIDQLSIGVLPAMMQALPEGEA